MKEQVITNFIYHSKMGADGDCSFLYVYFCMYYNNIFKNMFIVLNQFYE